MHEVLYTQQQWEIRFLLHSEANDSLNHLEVSELILLFGDAIVQSSAFVADHEQHDGVEEVLNEKLD